jgi:hypothetical protein
VSHSRPTRKPRQRKRRITKTSISNINTIGGASKRRRSRLALLSSQTVLKQVRACARVMPWTVEGQNGTAFSLCPVGPVRVGLGAVPHYTVSYWASLRYVEGTDGLGSVRQVVAWQQRGDRQPLAAGLKS